MNLFDKVIVYTCGVGDLLFVVTYAVMMRDWYTSWTGRFMMGWPMSTGILFWLTIVSQWWTVPKIVGRISIVLIAIFILARYGLLLSVDIRRGNRVRKEYDETIEKIIQEEQVCGGSNV